MDKLKDLNTVFRPKQWSDIKGQEKIVSVVSKQALAKFGLANSYIFSGKSGVGKTTIARLFFMALNCENPDKSGNPCLECANCLNTKFQLREVNASDSRGIDDMRELTKEMHYMASGNYKGILLDEVHMLSKPAWNCLLKPMEESPEKCIWILCTTELHKIPKTIQTRCQIFKLGSLSWTHIFNRLKEIVDEIKLSISDDELWAIARNSDNNLRQATHLLEQYSVSGNLEDVIPSDVDISFLNALAYAGKDDYKTLWKTFMEWEKHYSEIEAFLNSLKYDLSVCLKLKMKLPLGQISPFRLKKYQEIEPQISEEKLTKMFRLLLEIQEKTSGVYDYNSLFLNALCKYKS